jgi:hypothetical protein
MGPRLSKLLSIGSPALAEAPGDRGSGEAGNAGRELAEMLATRNGFFAFESALHVFPSRAPRLQVDHARMNGPDAAWRAIYWHGCDGHAFFAADTFGCLFAIHGDAVVRFDPETGTSEPLAPSLEEWADRILSDAEGETGYPLARDWQVRHGLLPEGRRLVPKIPFIMGGAYAASNLYEADLIGSLEFRADVANQIRDVPDGGKIKLKVVD